MTHEPPTGWDASAHPGFERLAELDEGLLDSADAGRVEEHVAGCAHCHDQQAQLTRTRTLLGTLPDEGMPADVVARLDAALADAASTESSPAQAASTVLPLAAKRGRWRIHPAAAGLGAAAAVAAVVAILVVGHSSGGGTGTPEQTSAAGATGADAALSNLTTTESGTDYTSKNLDSTVPPLVGGPHLAMTQTAPQPNTGAGVRKAAALPAALAHLHNSPDALRSCILGVEAGGAIERPLAIDFARYQGVPALLVVLPGLSAGFVDAWFVGAACTQADAHLLGYKAIPSSASSAGPPSPGG